MAKTLQITVELDAKGNLVAKTAEAGNALTKLGQKGKQAESSMSKLGGTVKKLIAAYLTLAAARKAIDFLSDSVKEAAKAEAAFKGLQFAVEANKKPVIETMQSYRAFADQMEETTRVGGGEVIMLAKLGEAHGLTTIRIQEMIGVAADMRAKLDPEGSIQPFFDALIKGSQGAEGALNKVFPDSALKNMKDFNNQLEYLQKKFSGAAIADIDTYSGKMAQLANKFDDMKEKIGKALIPALLQVAKNLEPVISNIAKWAEANQEVISQDISSVIERITTVASALWPIIKDLATGFYNVADAIAKTAAKIGSLIDKISRLDLSGIMNLLTFGIGGAPTSPLVPKQQGLQVVPGQKIDIKMPGRKFKVKGMPAMPGAPPLAPPPKPPKPPKPPGGGGGGGGGIPDYLPSIDDLIAWGDEYVSKSEELAVEVDRAHRLLNLSATFEAEAKAFEGLGPTIGDELLAGQIERDEAFMQHQSDMFDFERTLAEERVVTWRDTWNVMGLDMADATNFMTGTYDAFTQSMLAGIQQQQAFAPLFGKAMMLMAGQFAMAIGKEAMIGAAWEFAQGFAALANPVTAPLAGGFFAAGAKYLAVAALASSVGIGLMAAGSAGGGGGGRGAAGAGAGGRGGGGTGITPGATPEAERGINFQLTIQTLDPSSVKWAELTENHIAPAFEKVIKMGGSKIGLAGA